MIIKNGLIQKNFALIKKDIQIENGKIVTVADNIDIDGERVLDASGLLIVPAAVDVHIHLREPGFTDKETIATGTRSAAKGGVGTVMAMPNLRPVPDCHEVLNGLETIIKKTARVNVYPYASLTKGQLGLKPTDIKELWGRVKAFSDDGKGVNNREVLLTAMRLAAECGAIIASHAEADGYGDSPEAEYIAVERELELVRETGCKYHFCHMSTAKSFALIKKAKDDGLDVTCEVTPHHLFLTDEDVEDRPNYKMNPPLRSREDKEATLVALLTGVADMIATDHAPHTEAEKSLPFSDAPYGIIGLETLFPLVYTKLVKAGIASVNDMIRWVTVNPANRFRLPYSRIREGCRADIAGLDILTPHIYQQSEILSKGKNSPFIGESLYGFNKLTILNGKLIYSGENR
ncbi:MAG: dihydroorotase [Clostridia bacterium]